MDKKLQLSIGSMKFETSQEHVNKMVWSGIVTKIDTPSDGAPGGSGGMKAVFDRAGILAKYQTLQYMGLNVEWPEDYWSSAEDALTGHDIRFKIGFVTDVWIEGDNLMAKGIIWKRDFYDICTMIENGKDALGFSVEAMIDDYDDSNEDGFLHVKDLTFTGVALLWKNTAAFEQTQLMSLVANRQKREVDIMTPKEIQDMLDAMFSRIEGALSGLETKVEEKVEAAMANVKAELQSNKEADPVDPVVTPAVAPVAQEVAPAPAVEASSVAPSVAPAVPAVPARKSVEYATLGKFQSDKNVMKEISAKKNLTPQQRMAEKLKAMTMAAE